MLGSFSSTPSTQPYVDLLRLEVTMICSEEEAESARGALAHNTCREPVRRFFRNLIYGHLLTRLVPAPAPAPLMPPWATRSHKNGKL